MIEGIDTSHWESLIRWQNVAVTKRFVWCKATESYTYSDPDYKSDIQAAKAAGMLAGSFHFFRWAGDTIRQTNLFLNTIKDMPMDLPPMLDVEEEKIGYGWRNYQTALKLCLDMIEKATARIPIIYTSANFWQYTGYPSWASRYPLFVANYGVDKPLLPKGWTDWTFWQYSASGRVDGIPYESVDLDRFNGSYDDLLRFCKISPVIPEYTLEEKVNLLWNDHPLLHK